MPLVENLINLYRVDGQARALRSRLQSAERHLNSQTKQYNDLLQQQNELQTRRKQLQATSGATEVEIKSIDDRLEKLRGELNAAVNNKQYSAVLAELNTVKEQRSALEDRTLADMEGIEKIEEQLVALQAQMSERQKIKDAAQAQLEERKADVGQRLNELETERNAAAAVIPHDVLAVFDDLADTYDGEAMAAITEVDRKRREYTCAACNMFLPIEQISQLTSRMDALIRCPSCTRILYMQEEMRGSVAKK